MVMTATGIRTITKSRKKHGNGVVLKYYTDNGLGAFRGFFMPEFGEKRKEEQKMFVQFTEDQKRWANEASIVEILEQAGYEVKKSGSQYLWKGEGRTVSILDNLWFDHYTQSGGKTVSFVEKYFGLNYPEAKLMILGETSGQTVERN